MPALKPRHRPAPAETKVKTIAIEAEANHAPAPSAARELQAMLAARLADQPTDVAEKSGLSLRARVGAIALLAAFAWLPIIGPAYVLT